LNQPSTSHPSDSTASPGVLYAVLAYLSWGLLPIYWKFFGQVPAVEVLSHRIIWSMIFLMGVLLFQQRQAEFRQLWRSPVTSSGKRKVVSQQLVMLFLTTSLLSFNWGLYIYGINSDRVVETSLGYYINPLLTVLLGSLFLKERLNRGQKIAVFLAAIGVAYFIWQFGQIPWIALGLALSFGLYGLLRKVIPVAPMVGLAVETLLATPVALAFVGYGLCTETSHFGGSWSLTLLFIGCGFVTSFPLLWFNNAAKRLRLSTLGFFQYLAPSCQLLLGVFLYQEPFTPTHVVTFALIWTALIIYSTTSLMGQRSPQKQP
jgi:chloramphenicol-sensitive protein RarD